MGIRSASTSGKLGEAVLKASMIDLEVRFASTSAKFCVAVLKASVLNSWGVDLPSLG